MGHSDGKGSCPWSKKQKQEETQNKESEMGNASATVANGKVPEPPAPASSGKKLKACCACPETKKVRDACIIENGEENCGPLIEEHKACMRKMGFNI